MSSAPLSARVALVGPEFTRFENLGLRVLAAALRAEGHQPVLFPLISLYDFEKAAQDLIHDDPDIVAISIPCEGFAWLSAAFPHRLRQLGFQGTIVACGVFATLHAQDLLSASRGLDTVVRNVGEVAIVRLAEASIGRACLVDVPGIIMLDGDRLIEGAPHDDSRMNVWPWRRSEGLPKYLGLPAARMIASRGMQSFVPSRDASVCVDSDGGDNVWRRPVKDIINEMASLVFDFGARVFEFEDDTFLPNESREAMAFLRGLHGEMLARRMPKCAFTIKMRADQVSREVCEQLSRMGVVRAFVEIQSLSKALSRRLGRAPSSIPARVALGRLRRLGIETHFESRIIGPEFRMQDVEDELEALSTVRGVPFEVVRLVPYGGTDLAQRLEKAGRLRGCAFLREPFYLDERVAHLATSMARIQTRHFGKRCPAKRVVDLIFSLTLARRFYPRARLVPIERTVARLVSRVNGDQVHTIHEMISLIYRGESASRQLDQLVLSAMHKDRELCRAIASLGVVLEGEVQVAVAGTACTYFRGQLAGPLMAAIDMAGCGGSVETESSEHGVAPEAALDNPFEVDDSDTVIMDSPMPDDSEVARRCEELVSAFCLDPHSPKDPGLVEGASLPMPLAQSCGESGYLRATLRVEENGRGVLLELIGAEGPLNSSEPVFECLAELLARVDLSCFTGEFVVFEDPGPIE